MRAVPQRPAGAGGGTPARTAPARAAGIGQPDRPISHSWGYDRGTPVDRWYIDRFLEAHRGDITGRVLEVKDSSYTERFGRDVTEREVLDVDPANAAATYVADLANAARMPSETFDCFVLTQTLQYLFDVRAALEHSHRILRPGGVLLVTVPVASRVAGAPLTDYWRFTPGALKHLLEAAFTGGEVAITAPGNVLSQVAFLEGLASEDLTDEQLAVADERFPLIACGRAVRAA